MDLVTRPYPPYDQDVVSLLDSEFQRLATLVKELPPGPGRERPTTRALHVRAVLDRYISQHSTAGWDGP